MAQTVRLYVTLKNTDLHALSAAHALQGRVNGLRRVVMWELDIDRVADVDKILEQSFYILNPNKEAVSKTFSPKGHCLKVMDRKPESLAHLIAKIERKTGIRLQGLRRYLLWDIFSRESRENLEQSVVISSSRSRGLLINPVSQTFEWMSAS